MSGAGRSAVAEALGAGSIRRDEGNLHRSRNAQASRGTGDEEAFDWAKLRGFFGELKRYWGLLGLILVLAVAITVVNYAVSPKAYSAVAVLGPPGPSPTGSLLSGIGGGSTASLASRVLGGGGSAGKSDSYQDFQQVLPSTRLAQTLLNRDQFVQSVFAGRWDAEAHQWKRPGALGKFKATIKTYLGIPVGEQPTVDDVDRFLDSRLKVSKTSQASGGLLGGLSPYVQVSFAYSDPQQAERLLSQILSETDQIIRDDQRRNVKARINFLRGELAREALAVDERTALIAILSDQEHVLAMIEADQHFATTWIIPPYASQTPTSPSSLGRSLAVAMFISLLLFLGLVYSSLYVERIHRLIHRFRAKDRA